MEGDISGFRPLRAQVQLDPEGRAKALQGREAREKEPGWLELRWADRTLSVSLHPEGQSDANWWELDRELNPSGAAAKGCGNPAKGRIFNRERAKRPVRVKDERGSQSAERACSRLKW